MTGWSKPSENIIRILIGGLVFIGLYLTSLYSFLLFHSLVEIFTIVVAGATFILAWNTRHLLDNNYLLFIGISYIFVSTIIILHTLAYRGMGVFPGDDPNLPTQLWIAGQYLQSVSFLLAPFFINRRLKTSRLILGYGLATALLLASIFYWQIFPDCYMAGVGLTPFKKISEYLVSLIFLAAIGLLIRYRRDFDKDVWTLLILSLVVSIAAELTFTLYVGVYDALNLAGHFLRLIAFYLVYKAIVETGLVKPHYLLFRNLKQSEEKLRQSTIELQARNEELNTFSRTVAHDLKTPLAHLIGSSSVLLEYSPTLSEEERRESLQAIMQTAFKMNDIIDELLLLAQVRQKEVPLEPLNMKVILIEVQQRLAHMLDTSGAKLTMPPTWPVALGYAPWVEAVWANYISNAIKYGGQPPCITLGATTQANEKVRFWVQDNGPGVKPEDQVRLFTPFTRLAGTQSNGHGLGLSIVQRIVEKLGGEAGVKSEGVPGQGSQFFFTLPHAND
jgi:signal transduction histidine kinase